jgi:hypothetical protein
MYAMVYDNENVPVSGVRVFINKKEIISSDTQGRFILTLRKEDTYTIKLQKDGYEPLEEMITFDPMNVLYFKMVNVSQLLVLAEEALEKHRYTDAERLIHRGIALEPYRRDALYLLSITLYLEKKHAEAMALLDTMQNLGYRGAAEQRLRDFIQEQEDRERQ